MKKKDKKIRADQKILNFLKSYKQYTIYIVSYKEYTNKL